MPEHDGRATEEARCWRCDQPRSRHLGVAAPPLVEGHLGATGSRPGCCGTFEEPPENVEAHARMFRRQRDEYDREARRYRRTLDKIGAEVGRVMDEFNFS